MTPQARTVDRLRREGWLVASVEKWKRFPDRNRHFCPVCKQQPVIQVRLDLWGFADLLALHPAGEHYLLQVTDGTNHAKRVAKIIAHPEVAPNALKCLAAGMKIAVVSWAWQGPRGEKKKWTMRWDEIRREQITVESDALAEMEQF